MDLNRGRLHLLIVAAGSGRRMGAEGNKLLLPLQGRPLLAWTLESALASESIAWLGVVGQACDRQAIEALLHGQDFSDAGRLVNGEKSLHVLRSGVS